MTHEKRLKQANDIRLGSERSVEELTAQCEFLLPILMNGQAKMGGEAC